MDNSKKESFNYTYSAKEQKEIKAIREKYEPSSKSEDKMSVLRSLDAGVTKKATSVSLAFGTIGALILGIGMSLAMTDIGSILGLQRNTALLTGIPVGIIGIVLVVLAYPVYNKTLAKEREKIAPEILHLTDELMK